MQVDDNVKTYDVTDIATLEFTAPAAAASAAIPPVRDSEPGGEPYIFISRMLPFEVDSSMAGPPAPILPSR